MVPKNLQRQPKTIIANEEIQRVLQYSMEDGFTK